MMLAAAPTAPVVGQTVDDISEMLCEDIDFEELEGRTLPELPEGWLFYGLHNDTHDCHWICTLREILGDYVSFKGEGSTPRAAVLAAIKAINGGG